MPEHLGSAPEAAPDHPVPPCRGYARGHAPHPARVLLAQSGDPEQWRPVVVMGGIGGVVTLADGDQLTRWRNHDVGRLLDLGRGPGAGSLLNLDYGLLFLRSWPRDARAVFSLQPAAEPPLPCSPTG